jgi:hypothetical protein
VEPSKKFGIRQSLGKFTTPTQKRLLPQLLLSLLKRNAVDVSAGFHCIKCCHSYDLHTIAIIPLSDATERLDIIFSLDCRSLSLRNPYAVLSESSIPVSHHSNMIHSVMLFFNVSLLTQLLAAFMSNFLLCH